MQRAFELARDRDRAQIAVAEERRDQRLGEAAVAEFRRHGAGLGDAHFVARREFRIVAVVTPGEENPEQPRAERLWRQPIDDERRRIEHSRMIGERDAAGREQRSHVSPGVRCVLHMLEHHAREDEIKFAVQRGIDVAGDVETGGGETFRGKRQLARVNVVDGQRDAQALRPPSGVNCGPRPPPISSRRTLPVAVMSAGLSQRLDEGEHGRLVVAPRPRLAAVVAEPAQRRGEEGRLRKPRLDARARAPSASVPVSATASIVLTPRSADRAERPARAPKEPCPACEPRAPIVGRQVP